MNQFQQFGLVMGACFESVAALAVAFYAAPWLNERFPQSFDWSSVTYVLGLLLVLRSWYVVLRVLIKDQRTSELSSEKGATKNEKRHD